MTGTFALTFDSELIWGSFDTLTPQRFVQRYPDVRRIIERTLRMLERYEVPATWAVVGHLFLRSCARDATGLAHPELVRPGQRWWPGDWYAVDPCTDRSGTRSGTGTTSWTCSRVRGLSRRSAAIRS